jgi:phosphoribosylformylglycinamidine synthase
MVRTGTRVGPPSDAAVVRISGTKKFLAMKTDCNARYVYLNPRVGAEIAVAEAVRNVVCSGGKPLGITNCLNFGNPYKPESFWQFKEAVAGIASACRTLDVPVTGGNVSFYNEHPLGSIYPTPVIGVVGLIEKEAYVTTISFKHKGDDIILLGTPRGDINGSEYLKEIFGHVGNNAPHFDIEDEKRVHECCLDLIGKELINSAHDISDGGLAISVIESVIASQEIKMGCDLQLDQLRDIRDDFLLFGEEQGRIVLSSDPRNLHSIQQTGLQHGVTVSRIGKVTSLGRISFNHRVLISTVEATDSYLNSISRMMD